MLRVFEEMKEGTQGIFFAHQCERITQNHMYELTRAAVYNREVKNKQDAFVVRKVKKGCQQYQWVYPSRALVRKFPKGESMLFTEGPDKVQGSAVFRKKVTVNIHKAFGECKQQTMVGVHEPWKVPITDKIEPPELFSVLMMEV